MFLWRIKIELFPEAEYDTQFIEPITKPPDLNAEV